MNTGSPLFAELFPFHVTVGPDLCLSSVGPLVRRACPEVVVGADWRACFEVSGRGRGEVTFVRLKERAGELFMATRRGSPQHQFKGAWFAEDDRAHFLCWPVANEVQQLNAMGIAVRDIPAYAQFSDLLLLSRVYRNTLDDAEELTRRIMQRNHELEALNAALSASQARLGAFFETPALAIIVSDPSGRIVEINRAGMELFGHQPDAKPGGDIRTLLPGLPVAVTAEPPQDVSATVHELSGRHHDGGLFPAQVSSSEVLVDGLPLHVHFVQDVSERRQAEEELRLAAVTFDSQEAIMITDPGERIIRVNRAFETITGYRPEEVLGHTPRMLRSDRHDPEFHAEMWRRLNAEGRWSGVIWDRRKDGTVYPKEATITAVSDSKGATRQYVSIFRDITERKNAEAEIHTLAYYDRLTGLPNRRLLLDRIDRAVSRVQRTGGFGAIFFLDIDRFKQINDSFGHHVGDEMLAEVAKRLKDSVRDADTIGRFAGDEFIVLIESLASDADKAVWQTRAIGEKVLSVLAAPYVCGGKSIHASSSIGIAIFNGASATSVDSLITQADTAMYEAKKDRRGTLRFFDPAMQERLHARMALEDQLRSALREHRFELFLQPQCDDTLAVCGVEALIRLRGADGSLIPPAQFIPLAEEVHLILDIGRWVASEACQILDRWGREPVLSGIPLAINISGQHFSDPAFVAEMREVLTEYRIAPGRLKIELTESVAVANIDESIARIRELQALGIRLAMDDFGTGHSSLSYLQRLPFDQIKIDRSFVMSMQENRNDMFIVHSVLTMARMLGAEVIAEGVETQEQHNALGTLGCDRFQGYLFCKPIPVAECEAFLRERAAAPELSAGD